MSRSCSCPVCGRQGLPPDCAVCPQCDSDLTCFQVLDSLSFSKVQPDSPPANKKPRRFPWLAVLSGTALLLLLAVLAAAWTGKMPNLYHKLTASPEQETVQGRQTAPNEENSRSSDGKIHIDAQIRILDDRQKKQTACQSSQSALPHDEKQQADKPGQDQQEARQAVSPAAVDRSLENNPTAAEAVQQTAPVQPEENSGPEPQPPVELSDPAAKKAADKSGAEQKAAAPALPAQLPVLQGRRKRAVRTVFGLGEAAAKSTKKKNGKSTFVYHAQDGETVWELAERFYGEGKYYPLIMELNPHILQGSVRGGGKKVRILADRRQAAALYQRNTEQRDGLLLWRHKVRPGETWQSIYARFFPPKYSGMVFYPGDQNVVPGSTVKIILR
jgi:hypothetical protein